MEKNRLEYIVEANLAVRCKRCGKQFLGKAISKINQKKFCSSKCRTRYNALSYYHSKKNDRDYKKRKKAYFKKWVINNRQRLNEMLREPNRIRRKYLYHLWDSQKKCTQCGRLRDGLTKICNVCKRKRYSKK